MTKLMFLGTKGEIEEYSKKHKYQSSLLLTKKKFKLLIDYGMLHKSKLEKIKPNAIFITHAHPDHHIWTKKEIKTKNIHWTKPKIVVQIAFTEWTKKGKLRHPDFSK